LTKPQINTQTVSLHNSVERNPLPQNNITKVVRKHLPGTVKNSVCSSNRGTPTRISGITKPTVLKKTEQKTQQKIIQPNLDAIQNLL